MIASTEWKEGTQYVGSSGSGHTIHFDADQAHTTGPSPMEVVLTALCGCTSMDIVSILQKKREPITSLAVSAEAQQSPAPPRVFTHIRLVYRVGGAVSKKGMEDAVSLSKNKYCSVSKMLEKNAAIEFVIEYMDGVPRE
ncbi:OsmC family protein [Alloacidobacterium dinghuense]|uniref:OsmC family protein n=1 Tax=Alloacidobacterium dinghuense TaxID=2763107 RepID=A0A7G8BHV5_9BACT|nr:OsmC family protein [Alloacidobacterium dinghuense]QNI32125.1 OsmC family protein [Alloacidobacterium dinghuense]